MPYSIYRMLVLASVLPLAERVREEMQQLFDEHRLPVGGDLPFVRGRRSRPSPRTAVIVPAGA